jgi:altronate dehydratase small subunit
VSDSCPEPDQAPTLLLLAVGDDVLIATSDLGPGRHRASNMQSIELVEHVPLGHKVAARRLTVGEQVVRYGVPIGSMTADVAAGGWVHTHNLASDYIVTYSHRGGVA